MADSKALINLGDFAKPVNTLITKISDAIGVLYEPTRMVRKVKAEMSIEELKLINELKIEDIKKRAIIRLLNDETKKQENIENIINKAMPLVKESAEADRLENDWLSSFFEKSKIISNEDMQIVWSKILAAETNNNGSFSKMTLKIVSELEKKDAEAFTKLCSFCFDIGNPTVVIFDVNESIYKKFGITFDLLKHFDTLGLISFESVSGYIRQNLPSKYIVQYFSKRIAFDQSDESNELQIGSVLFTKAGQELFRISGAQESNEICEYSINKWKETCKDVKEI